MTDRALIEHDEHLPAPAGNGAVQVFNPLDAEPAAFKRALQSRQDNYDALALHLRAILVPGKDFGKIHVMPKDKCPKPWECTTPSHYSEHQLFASGADKILGVLSLGCHYPGEQDIMRAALTGKPIAEVILKCGVIDGRGNTIAEGMGACARKEVNDSLNNAVKRACKRARVDAVKRLPSVSALFESDFLQQVEQDAAAQRGNSTSARAQSVKPRYDTGATLEAMPFGKHQGQRFAELPDQYLEWGLENFKDKPDVHAALVREHERRFSPGKNPGSAHGKTSGAPPIDWDKGDDLSRLDPHADTYADIPNPTGDDLPPLDIYDDIPY